LKHQLEKEQGEKRKLNEQLIRRGRHSLRRARLRPARLFADNFNVEQEESRLRSSLSEADRELSSLKMKAGEVRALTCLVVELF